MASVILPIETSWDSEGSDVSSACPDLFMRVYLPGCNTHTGNKLCLWGFIFTWGCTKWMYIDFNEEIYFGL